MEKHKITQLDRIARYADLIQKQAGKAVRPYRVDGYVNMLTRYGTQKDASERYKFVPEDAVPDELLTMYYEGNGLFAKIIDMPAEEAIKHGFTLDDVSDQEVEDFYTEALDELDWEETAMTAIKWARLFGGSLAVMLINDGRGLDEPLDWRHIQTIDDIRVFDRSVIQPDYTTLFNYDPRDPFSTRGSRLGLPEYYQIFSKYGSFTVHDSRCLVFQNGILPENTTNSIYQLWGVPEYIRLHRAIRDAEIAHRSAPKMLDRSVQPVYKMNNLSAELATEEGENMVLRRLQAIDMARGLLNSLIIDANGEDYDFKTFQFSGINDVVSASCNMLSALSNIPQTILFGQSVGGMSSTDDTSMENYYNYIERIQRRMLKSNLRYLLSIIFQAGLATGEVDEVPKIKIKFNPLWSMSDVEQADLEQKQEQTKLIRAQTAQIYVGMQAIDPSEVRQKLADSEEFDVEAMLDEYDDDELFPATDPVDAQGQPVQPSDVTGLFEQSDFAAYGQDVSVEEHNADPETGGNAPAAAPAATKLPQDMSAEELADKAEKGIGNADGADGIINRPKESVGVLVISDGKVLSGTRHNDFGYGLVCGPGGHVELGETPIQAAFRETEEEFGISPKELIPLGLGPYEPDTGLRPHLFLCTDYDGEPDCADLEMTGARFRTMAELDELATSMFQPFADGLEILKQCIDTALFFGDDGGEMHDDLVDSIGKAVNGDPEKEDGGPGSGNHGHKGVPGEVGGSLPNGGDAGLSSMSPPEAAASVGKYGVGSTVKITKKSGKQITFTKIGDNRWKRDDQPEFEYEDMGVGSNCWKAEVEVNAKAPEAKAESGGGKGVEKKAEEREGSPSSKPTGPKGTTAASSVSELVGEKNLEEYDTGEYPNKYDPGDSRWGTEPGEYTVYRSGSLDRDVVFTASDYDSSSTYAKGFPDAEGRDILPINSGVYSYTVQIKKPFVAEDLADTYQKLFGTKLRLEPTAAQAKKGLTTGDLWVKADEKIAAKLRSKGYDAWLMRNPAPPAKKELNLIGSSISSMKETSRKVPDNVKKAWSDSIESGGYFSYAFKDGVSQNVTINDWFSSEAYKKGKEEGKWR